MSRPRFHLRLDCETGSRISFAAFARRVVVATSLAVLFATVAVARAQGGVPPIPTAPNALTLQQVVEQARGKNPTLLSAQQTLLSVKSQEIQAGLRQNPDLAVAGSNVSLSTTNPAGPYFYSGQVSRLFERGEKRRWRLDSATSATDQTRDQYALLEQQTVLTVKQAFTTMLLAK